MAYENKGIKETQLTLFGLKSHTRDDEKYQGFFEGCHKEDYIQFWREVLKGGYFTFIWRKDVECTNMMNHTHVQYPSKGKVLVWFKELLPDIKECLKISKHTEYVHQEDIQCSLETRSVATFQAMHS